MLSCYRDCCTSHSTHTQARTHRALCYECTNVPFLNISLWALSALTLLVVQLLSLSAYNKQPSVPLWSSQSANILSRRRALLTARNRAESPHTPQADKQCNKFRNGIHHEQHWVVLLLKVIVMFRDYSHPKAELLQYVCRPTTQFKKQLRNAFHLGNALSGFHK